MGGRAIETTDGPEAWPSSNASRSSSFGVVINYPVEFIPVKYDKGTGSCWLPVFLAIDDEHRWLLNAIDDCRPFMPNTWLRPRSMCDELENRAFQRLDCMAGTSGRCRPPGDP